MADLRDLEQHRVRRAAFERDRQVHARDFPRDSVARFDAIHRARRLGDHAFDLSCDAVEGDSRGEAGFDGEVLESWGDGRDIDGVVEAEEGIGRLGVAKNGLRRRRRSEELDLGEPDFVGCAD